MFEKISGVITARIHDKDDHSDEEGFTLIELLIVVIVLGILAAVTVFGLSGATGQSAVSACKSDARTVEVAMDAFHANDAGGNWPNPANGPNGFGDLLRPDLVATQPQGPPPEAPYLRAAPNNLPHYTLTVQANGQLLVTPTAAPAQANTFDSTPNPCDSVK
jgi:prepilin-type N-terminal cleavage/methylation domain-containing protein